MRNLELAALPFVITAAVLAVQRMMMAWRGEPLAPVDHEARRRHIGMSLIGFIALALWITWVNKPDF